MLLKVMSFNIRYGTADDGINSWSYRREAVLGFLDACDCGIIGLQEALAGQLDEIRKAAPHLHFAGVGRDDGGLEGEHCAILFDSRRLEVVSSQTHWFSDTPEVVGSRTWGNKLCRIWTQARFKVEGSEIDCYNVHLDDQCAASRIRSVELLTDRIRCGEDATPAIVMGDFNESETEPAVAEMLASGFVDTFRELNPDGAEQATYHGWTDTVLGRKIDYIFRDEGIPAVEASIIRGNPYRRYLSDHNPVTAWFRI